MTKKNLIDLIIALTNGVMVDLVKSYHTGKSYFQEIPQKA
jgi:hypothetical protein